MPGFGNSRLSRAGMRMMGAFQDVMSPGGGGGRAINDFMGQTAGQARRMPRAPMSPSTMVTRSPRGRGGMFGSTTTYDNPNFLKTDTRKGLFGLGGRSSSLQVRRPPMD
jgi:hypothetical protein